MPGLRKVFNLSRMRCWMTGSSPRILIVATTCWPLAARLAMRFRDAGGRVSWWGPGDHPLKYVSGLEQHFGVARLDPMASLAKALEASGADRVVPTDDLAAWMLHGVAERNPELGARIELSLGRRAQFGVLRSRVQVLALARELGIATPRATALGSAEEAEALGKSWPMPVVMKSDGSNGGHGVLFAQKAEELAAAWHSLRRQPTRMAAWKRLLVNGDEVALLDAEALSKIEISAQEFIPGIPANAMFACDKGRVLAGIQVRVEVAQNATGASSIVRRIYDARIAEAGKILASALGLSGFFGLDFHLEPKTERPVLLELNPRSTQLGHLALDATGRTLASELMRSWDGDASDAITDGYLGERIAFFPQALVLGEAELAGIKVDRPEGEAALLRELSARPWNQRRLVARMYDSMRRSPIRKPVRFK